MVRHTASLALMFYVGLLVSQTFCQVHSVDAEARSEISVDHQTAMGHRAPGTTSPASDGRPPHHGDHSDAPGPNADTCAMAVCGVAVVATADRFVAQVKPVFSTPVTSLVGITPPESGTATPPPRLG